MSYCKGGVVVCFNSGTLQEGQLSFHGDQTSNISTEVALPRPAVKVLRAQLSYDKRRTLHIRSIVL